LAKTQGVADALEAVAIVERVADESELKEGGADVEAGEDALAAEADEGAEGDAKEEDAGDGEGAGAEEGRGEPPSARARVLGGRGGGGIVCSVPRLRLIVHDLMHQCLISRETSMLPFDQTCWTNWHLEPPRCVSPRKLLKEWSLTLFTPFRARVTHPKGVTHTLANMLAARTDEHGVLRIILDPQRAWDWNLFLAHARALHKIDCLEVRHWYWLCDT
jgi:hypothetical protein